MANPTILINSATGSDVTCSGAGPTTPLFGSSATTNASGSSVTLNNSPNLSTVSTDGSHILFINDTVAGRKNFSVITAVNNSTKVVSVTPAFATNLSGLAWAIGGKRQTLFNGRLVDNGSSGYDALGGWTMELESGHTEVRSSTVTFNCPGDITSGRVTVKASDTFTVMPTFTFTNNGIAIFLNYLGGALFQDIEFINTNVSKSTSTCFSGIGTSPCMFRRIKIDHPTNNFGKYAFEIIDNTDTYAIIDSCKLGYMENAIAIINNTVSSSSYVIISNCDIGNTTKNGVSVTYLSGSLYLNMYIVGNNIYNAGEKGITVTSDPGSSFFKLNIQNNTINNCGQSGINISTSLNPNTTFIQNNNITNNGRYGIETNVSTIMQSFNNWVIDKNNIFNNTLGSHNITLSYVTNTFSTNPGYVNSTSGNFTPLTLRGISSSYTIGTYGNSVNYINIGSVQHKDSKSFILS